MDLVSEQQDKPQFAAGAVADCIRTSADTSNALTVLASANALLAAIVESTEDAVISKDLNGNISSWNAAAERLFGYSAAETVGRSITMLIPPDRLVEEEAILAKIRKGERFEHFDTVRRCKDGTLVDVSITVSPVKDPSGLVVGASKIARDIRDRKRAQEQQALLIGEMKHRARNFRAIIDALAKQSVPAGETNDALNKFVGRLHALLSMGEIVVDSPDRRVPIAKIAQDSLSPFLGPDRQSMIAGPDFSVSEQTAGSLALAFHELATNAVKYGALRTPEGTLELLWSLQDNLVVIEWKERGVTSVREPTRVGFGSQVIRTAVAREPDSRTELCYEADGLRCRFEFRAVGRTV